MNRHVFVNSNPSGYDSDCKACGGKFRDAIHLKIETAFASASRDTLIDVINPATNLSQCYGKDLAKVRQEYPDAEIVNIAEWCKAKGERQDCPIQWQEITEEKFYDMLNVLPPAAMVPGAFLVGEPTDHHAGTGRPRFAAFKSVTGSEKTPKSVKFFESNRPLTHKEFCQLFGKSTYDYIE